MSFDTNLVQMDGVMLRGQDFDSSNQVALTLWLSCEGNDFSLKMTRHRVNRRYRELPLCVGSEPKVFSAEPWIPRSEFDYYVWICLSPCHQFAMVCDVETPVMGSSVLPLWIWGRCIKQLIERYQN